MVLEVGAKALQRRRDQLRKAAESVETQGEFDDTPTVGLLLFYAAECGLKERVLARRGHRDSTALEPTHNLRRLAKDLRLPRALGAALDRIQVCRLHPPTRGSVALADLHQAWRYGAKLNTADEKAAQEALRALISWCEQD
ncbi:hypothetical protein I5Q34_13700 [Streptomyces sp. AV19]|uniref:hypothetical protein n=1 Tax=Streptomyces sp. AV19 TaxID=2793068 RepID=UPI0018FE6B5E|nr:hypothetical protein [Streptomyces sp. AV19]MBH1935314.1 hypothetical protein [Streptomyces sp. AV19]MDG4531199.1 hypothetical protein [Streptomyces sp. AV19]